MENIQTILVSLAAVLAMVVAAYWAYQEGYANPIIEKIGYGPPAHCLSFHCHLHPPPPPLSLDIRAAPD